MRKIIITLLILIAYQSFGQNLNMTQLPSTINSKATEYAPSLSADGQTMVFQSNVDGKYKLYISKQINGVWSKSIPIDGINNYDKESALIGGPSLSYDGNQIYFFSFFKSGFGLEDIYFSNRNASGWGMPINAGKMINTSDYEGFPSISSDGNKLYFIRKKRNKDNPNVFCTKIMVSERDSKGNWKLPIELPPPINLNCEKCPRILSDNETLIFASNRLNKQSAVNDLFLSRLSPDQSWTDPLPIAPLNTPGDDQFATISSKGDLVYFINDKAGNYDIYFAELPEMYRPRKVTDIQGIVQNEMQHPISAGIFIYADGILKNQGGLVSNESDGAFGYTLTHGFSYQVITQAPGHHSDTFNINLKAETAYGLKKRDIVLKEKIGKLIVKTENAITHAPILAIMEEGEDRIEQEVAGQFSIDVRYQDSIQARIEREGFESQDFNFNYNADKVTLNYTIALKPVDPSLFIQVIDKDTKSPISPELDLLEEGNATPVFRGKMLTEGLRKNLNFDKIYRIRIRLPGYFSFQDTINLAGVFEGRKVNRIIPLVQLKEGNKLSLSSIYFGSNSAELSDDSKGVLDEVAFVLRQNRNVTVEIGAHSDDVGENSFNLTLSQKRADAVKAYLLTRGVLDSALSSKGYGEINPVAPNDSEENRALNRRVEFIILKVR
ncbi:MAG TPA: OmpA family protein [Cyclobacteriaceae bacterium]